MNESSLQTVFSKENKIEGVFELKWFDITKTRCIAFNRLADHQREALLSASGTGLYHKIRDVGMHQKPFDCFYFKGVDAYVVVCVYEPRKRKTYYYIKIQEWDNMVGKAQRKSATEDMLGEYAYETIQV